MGKYERRWHSPYYWDGWDAPGSNLTSLTRGKCPAGAPPSIECPRCQENPRAGACPEPGPMADLMRLFPRVLIICGGFECARHAGGYWPQDVQARIRLVRFEPVNLRLAAELGQGLSLELGIGPALAGAPPRLSAAWQAATQKRLLPLAAHLHAVALAAEEGVDRVMILESDLKPLVANRLPPAQLAELSQTLRTRPWQIFRPTGYHRAFTSSRTKQRNGSCTAACACTPISPALPRACEVKAGAAWRQTSHTPTAAHTRQRPPVARTAGAAGAAGSCMVPDYSAADTVISGAAPAAPADAGSAYCEVNDNDMYGVQRAKPKPNLTPDPNPNPNPNPNQVRRAQ